MALVKLKPKGQITLPAEIRAALSLREGDWLEAEIEGGRVYLRPKTVVDRDAFARMAALSAAVRERWEAEGRSEEELEGAIAEAVSELRAHRRSP